MYCILVFCVWENSTERFKSHGAIRVLWPDNHQHPKILHYSNLLTHTHAVSRSRAHKNEGDFPTTNHNHSMGGGGQAERWITETEISNSRQLQTAATTSAGIKEIRSTNNSASSFRYSRFGMQKALIYYILQQREQDEGRCKYHISICVFC